MNRKGEKKDINLLVTCEALYPHKLMSRPFLNISLKTKPRTAHLCSVSVRCFGCHVFFFSFFLASTAEGSHQGRAAGCCFPNAPLSLHCTPLGTCSECVSIHQKPWMFSVLPLLRNQYVQLKYHRNLTLSGVTIIGALLNPPALSRGSMG